MTILQLEDFDLVSMRIVAGENAVAFLNLLEMTRYWPEDIVSAKTVASYAECKPGSVQSRGYCLVRRQDGWLAGRTHLGICAHDKNMVSTESAIRADCYGVGLGSILLAKTVALAHSRNYTRLGAVIDEEKQPSWQRYERLVEVGIAMREWQYDDGRYEHYRHYAMFTSACARSVWSALLPKAHP